jgi:hypothetical protein
MPRSVYCRPFQPEQEQRMMRTRILSIGVALAAILGPAAAQAP